MNTLKDLFDEVRGFPTPPLARWHPQRTEDIDIHIDYRGGWFYQGSPIARQKMIKLFATLLRRECETWYLLTPAVRYRIRVDDVPLLAVEMQVAHAGDPARQIIALRTNTDDVFAVDTTHPISLRRVKDEAIPYARVRDTIDARVVRSVFYEMAELAEENGEAGFALRSAGTLFPLA